MSVIFLDLVRNSTYEINEAAAVLYVSWDSKMISKRSVQLGDIQNSATVLFEEKNNSDLSHRSDGFGSWINIGGKAMDVQICFEVYGVKQMKTVTIVRTYFQNKTEKRFIRRIPLWRSRHACVSW